MITETVILAGGRGERLRPLTDSIPKPLLPIRGIPVLSHALRALEKCGIRRVTLSLGYGADAVKAHYGKLFRTVSLHYVTEGTPLGTAGAVKKAALHGDALMARGDILVLSGDTLFEGDLSALIEAHSRSGADLTIAAKRLASVEGYGVILGSSHRIEGFVEKPDSATTPSHLVNLGIYVLSARLLAEIPEGPYDFGRQLFPALLQKGYTLAYHEYEAYWCDIGSFPSYLDANLRQSGGKSVLGNRVTLSPSATVTESVLLDGVMVGDGCCIHRSVIGENAVIGAGVSLSGTVIGADCFIDHSLTNATTTKSEMGVAVTPVALPMG